MNVPLYELESLRQAVDFLKAEGWTLPLRNPSGHDPALYHVVNKAAELVEAIERTENQHNDGCCIVGNPTP